MVTKRVTFHTRPFQPFFLAAEDLLRLALPYYEQIKRNQERYERTHIVEASPRDVWQLEKSLSIGSFMAKYAGLEALVNCVHEDFKARKAGDLPADYFVAPLNRLRDKLLRKVFGRWHLATRVFLVAPLCSDPIVDPRDVFDVTSAEWSKFEEIVHIRHSFNHAAEVQIQTKVTKIGPKLWEVNDEAPDNFWPLTNAPKDHRILNYQAAFELNAVIGWVVNKLRAAMPAQLDDTYMTQEKAQVSDD